MVQDGTAVHGLQGAGVDVARIHAIGIDGGSRLFDRDGDGGACCLIVGSFRRRDGDGVAAGTDIGEGVAGVDKCCLTVVQSGTAVYSLLIAGVDVLGQDTCGIDRGGCLFDRNRDGGGYRLVVGGFLSRDGNDVVAGIRKDVVAVYQRCFGMVQGCTAPHGVRTAGIDKVGLDTVGIDLGGCLFYRDGDSNLCRLIVGGFVCRNDDSVAASANHGEGIVGVDKDGFIMVQDSAAVYGLLTAGVDVLGHNTCGVDRGSCLFNCDVDGDHGGFIVCGLLSRNGDGVAAGTNLGKGIAGIDKRGFAVVENGAGHGLQGAVIDVVRQNARGVDYGSSAVNGIRIFNVGDIIVGVCQRSEKDLVAARVRAFGIALQTAAKGVAVNHTLRRVG